MRVVMLSVIGGVLLEYYLKPLVTGLLQTGQVSDITILVPEYSDAPSPIRDLDTDSCQVRKFRFGSSLPRAMLGALNPRFYHRLVSEVETIDPDVVHIVFELRVPFLLVNRLHRRYPIVSTIHEPRPILHAVLKSVLLNPIQEASCRLIMKSSDKVIVHGQNHRRYLLAKRIPDHKVRIVQHGVFASFVALRNDKVKTQPQNILFFGRITPYKGIEYLIEAAKLITQRFSQANVTIAGEGDFDKYRDLIGGDSHFTIYNMFIPDSEVAALFQRASVVVLPYTDGSQSGIISIAGSFKKPVVATDVGNFAEMVQDGTTGIVVPPRDADALAKAIIELLNNDKLRQEMGENACKKANDELSWDNIAEKTIDVYEEAIQARHKV